MQEPTKQQADRAIDWLNQYQRAKYREKLAQAELEQARDAALQLSARLDGLPRPMGGHSDKTARAAERLDLARRASRAAAIHTKLAYVQVGHAIAGVEDLTQREILRRRYLLGETLGQIARTIGMDYRWLRRLHRRAAVRAAPVEVTAPGLTGTA